jgi:UDP-N-acetylmuramoyl-L-alanyl-D-glutamate--2,6-diaminopimelate ligase
MKLKALLRGIESLSVHGSKEVDISGLTADSRTAAPGSLFVVKKGTQLDGAKFIEDALRAGATALLTDLHDPSQSVTQIIVKNPVEFEPLLASRFYGHPSKELFIAGITGTKGKTTTTYMVQHLLQGLGKRSGLVSTVETILGGERRPSTLTTHSVIHNHRFLKEALSKKGEAIALEVSSHGLEQRRVDAVELDVALCTNLFPDHLDYHPTMEDYAIAKKKLFQLLDASSKKKKRAVFNADSPWAAFMREGIQAPSWTFGIENAADIRATEIRFDSTGTTFVVSFEKQTELFSIALMGRFNVYNALGAISVGLHAGATLAQMVPILKTFQTAPGRLEQVRNAQGILVFVDYAHNGEALENVLRTLREIARKRVLCLFGCGGNRDPARRTEMAKAAEKWADLTIVTSDNPRTEDPMSIIRQILSGFTKPEKALVVPDRKEAICRAVQLAVEGDILLIAGKGHEKIQIFAHQTVPFDDVAVAKEALSHN